MPVTLRTVRIDAGKLASPTALSHLLANGARKQRDALIAAGRASPQYETRVDGRLGAKEETVRPDGEIAYLFSSISRAVTFAQAFLVEGSPIVSGRFKKNWLVIVNGARWSADLARIPPNATVFLVNTSDYARRLEQGRRFKKPGLGFKLVEKARQATMRRYPALSVERKFLAWSDAYVSKGRAPLQKRKETPLSSAFRGGRNFLAVRKDTAGGQRITLPALQIQRREA